MCYLCVDVVVDWGRCVDVVVDWGRCVDVVVDVSMCRCGSRCVGRCVDVLVDVVFCVSYCLVDVSMWWSIGVVLECPGGWGERTH